MKKIPTGIEIEISTRPNQIEKYGGRLIHVGMNSEARSQFTQKCPAIFIIRCQ